LDKKKTVSALAELVTREGVSVDELRTALAPRIESAENLQIAIAQAVQKIAAVLDPDQREEFAHLIRSDALKL
jgi:lambda repressor-like predicted transcriptional regulator